MAHQFQGLASIAPYMRGLRADPRATVHYDLFADALVWSDELPVIPAERSEQVTMASFRTVLRYRTTLMLAAPEEKYEAYWEEAAKLFPEWPGFHPQRRDTTLRSKYLELREKAIKRWDDLDAKSNGIDTLATEDGHDHRSATELHPRAD